MNKLLFESDLFNESSSQNLKDLFTFYSKFESLTDLQFTGDQGNIINE